MNGVAAPLRAPFPVEAARDSGRRPERRSVSVVMVVYRTGEALEQSLACVLADPLVDEFVIVDNGSSSSEVAHLEGLARDPRVVLVQGQGNVGFARGANLGAARARGDALVFLNPDAFLQPGCIAGLVREVEATPGLCLVGGRVLNADRSEQRGARRGDITPRSALLSMSGLARMVPGWRRFEVHWEDQVLPPAPTRTPTISGACFCMRREDFAALGGFDEGYFLHVEDVDLCWRVRQAGGVVLFHPKAEVIHVGGTSRSSPLKVEFHKGVGLARYFRKRAAGGWQWLSACLLSPFVIALAVARPLVRRVRG
ncbi:glycosyltransferase family 2 protein [uncultured Phenylobacterium sp.]|uniref:glycosyltransferase family 2 protein n=1 Tax=uncultured Phenylobacterium sp. TaxID=349273 RepID=UPI0025DCB00F|nr:glycosyltransferase family 2 protein [uncultured Phenylobacterium sp.]